MKIDGLPRISPRQSGVVHQPLCPCARELRTEYVNVHRDESMLTPDAAALTAAEAATRIKFSRKTALFLEMSKRTVQFVNIEAAGW